ncbi:MAG: DUF998 domain-containing protein [Archangiaceae bacterium]|nr:DUF998 domain-containing protein [Archangiaceae bacterium]
MSLVAARLALVAGALALVCLAALHVLSPEFEPSWRMVSEYANGKYPWVLTLFFASWAVSSWAVAVALWPSAGSWVVKLGLGLVGLSGLGAALGGAFDVNHPSHGLAFALGVPTLPIGALLVGVPLSRGEPFARLRWVSQLPWVSLVLMVGSFVLLGSSAARAGVELDPTKPWHEVPAGVTAVMGWANRLLVTAYVAWSLVAARLTLRSKAA